MTNAYDFPEATATHMEKLYKNKNKIAALRKIFDAPGTTYHLLIKTFTELYMIAQNDPHAQKRLVLELEMKSTQRELTRLEASE